MRFIVFLVPAAFCLSCVSYEPRPISPKETAVEFESRSLRDPNLMKFVKENSGRDANGRFPDLQTLVLAACFFSYEIAESRAEVDIADAEIRTAAGFSNPSISIGTEYSGDPHGGTSPWMRALLDETKIEIMGKRDIRIALKSRQAEAARLRLRNKIWDVKSKVRAAVLNLYDATRREDLVQDQISAVDECVRSQVVRLMVGESATPEVLSAEKRIDQLKVELNSARIVIAAARAHLAEAIGVPVAEVLRAEIDFSAFARAVKISPGQFSEIKRAALLGRADVLASLADYAASEEALRLEVAKQYPDIQLAHGYTFDKGENKWILGAALSIPFFNENEGPIAEARARREQAAVRFRVLQSRIITELEQARDSYAASLKQLAAADELLDTQKKILNSIESRGAAGEIDRTEYLLGVAEFKEVEFKRHEAVVSAQELLGKFEDAAQANLSLPIVLPRESK